MNSTSTDTSGFVDGVFDWASRWLGEPAVLRHPDPAAERRFWRSAADAAARGGDAHGARHETWHAAAQRA